ncbi:MAG TPA: NAD(P)-dependent oxidoreductase [Candidatus Limnocylindria bacterium]|jgi:3-hydroxyisobutyrate dehydrogenase-like beta-hydroxyacid dehydrogenase|nr:NAD(P)-dependent oxidoreductase [Candidatus Limnocylindria bacterium]
MENGNLREHRLGWVGTGRMGYALAARLAEAGCDLAVYNRTRSKAEPLADLGATVVDSPAELSGRDIVFTMVAGPDDFRDVVVGDRGLLSRPGAGPRIIVDSTTVSPEASAHVRAQAAERGTDLLAAPVSGNPRVVESGRLTFAVSGPEAAYEEVRPYLDLLGAGATYVGEGERARLVKICHNLMLGVVAQSMAEIAVLAEKGGISRASLFDFINKSVMGSMFTRYKTPAYVNLDFHVTFTPLLLRKDFDLGFEAARALDVPMPVSAAARQEIQALIGAGYRDTDFATLLELQAKLSGLELLPEDVEVTDGLGDADEARQRLSARPAE